MQVLCLYRPRKFKPRLESELSKQQYTVTLFDCNHLTHVIVLFANAKIYVTVQFLLCFILDLRTISEYRTWRRDLSVFFGGGGGAYAWRGYFRDFTVYFNLMENE